MSLRLLRLVLDCFEFHDKWHYMRVMFDCDIFIMILIIAVEEII